jgi:hypothetical protein
MKDLVKLRTKFKELLDEHAHQCMRNPASDPFQHGVLIGQYRAYEMIISAVNEAMKDEDTD